MKKLMLLISLYFIFTLSFGQSYDSYFMIKQSSEHEIDETFRIIKISDEEITVSNLWNGGKETAHFIVEKIEDKDWGYGVIYKTYYGVTDYGQKFIAKLEYSQITIGVFYDELSLYVYIFNLSKK